MDAALILVIAALTGAGLLVYLVRALLIAEEL